MARKDVNLVIRAKDEAEKVISSITAALNDFLDAQKGVQKGSSDTESTLSSLGAAIGTLNKQVQGLKVGEILEDDISKASRAVARLEAVVEATGSEFRQMKTDLSGAAAATDRLRNKTANAQAILKRQADVVGKLAEESKQLSAAQKTSETAVTSLTGKQEKLSQQLAKQEASLAKTRARNLELADALRATDQPSKTLLNNIEANNRKLADQEARLVKTRAAFDGVESELRAAASAQALFAGQAGQAAQALARQEGIYGRIEANVASLETRTKTAATAQNRIEADTEKAGRAFQRYSTDLREAEQVYTDLSVAAGAFDRQLAGSAAGARSNLDQQLVAQAIAAREAREELNRLEATVSKLEAEIGAVGVPTREMSRALALATQEADEANYRFQLHEEALERVQRAYRETGTDIQSIVAAQQRFTSSQAQLSASMSEVAQDGFKARQAIRALHTETEEGANASRRHGQATRDAGRAADQGAGSVNRLAQAYRNLYGETRRSLSYTQRIRGEILSLISAYGGLYGAINVLRGSSDAFQTLEAATSRLGVAFDGDTGQVAQEMDFLRRTANRLGVDLGTLATEYSKFSIATKGTNLEGENTRKIFTAVAEAARVNRSSTEEMRGVFTALTQIVSKGAVQMEELRQQLGDRLPGAIQLMADGLGVTTAELIKMMEQGEVTADALVPFSEELQRRFGPGLTDALQSSTVAFGRLSNALFQAGVRFAEGGFIQSLTELANTLAEVVQSSDFIAFMDNLSSVVATLIDVLAVLARNFDLVFAALSAFLSLKVASFFGTLIGGFVKVDAGAKGAAASITIFGRTASVAAGSVGLLGRALLLLLSPTGLGLAIAAISAGIALWSTRAEEADAALNDHKKIVDTVRDAYDAVGGSVDEWKDKLNDLTEVEAQANLDRVKNAVKDLEEQFASTALGTEDFYTNLFGTNLRGSVRNTPRELRDELEQLSAQFLQGNIDAQTFYDSVDEAVASLGDGSEEATTFAERVVQAARALDQARQSQQEATDVVEALTNANGEASEAFDRLGNDAAEAGRDIEKELTEKAERFEAAMAELRDRIPEVKQQLDYLAESDAIEKFLLQSLQAATTWGQIGEAIRAAGGAMLALNAEMANGIPNLSGASDGAAAAAALLRESEGFRATPYYDVNAFRVGYGSDTVTLSDGTIKKVTQGMRVSVEDANRDLLRRINTEFLPGARNKVGASAFDALSPAQQGVLVSLTYNYGSLPDSVASAVKSGMSDSGIAQAIRSLGAGSHAGTKIGEGLINRRNQEAAVFESGVGQDAAIRRQEQAAEDAQRERERAEEERRKQAEATQQRIADTNFELEQQQRVNDGKERQAAIEEAIREAKAENPAITQAELDLIAQQVGATYDLAQAKKNSKTASEQAKEAEQEVNNLLTQRNELQKQLELAQENGETEKATELKTEIAGINEQLIAAIDNAIAMWTAIGGTEADAAIAKLQTAKMEAANLGNEGQKNYLQWDRVGDLFVNGLTNAFDKFAQAVANGENVGEAARQAFLQFASDFLREIATMILKQAIFNALRAAFGGTPFGSLIGIGAGHTGGLVGASRVGGGNQTRQVSPAAFIGASRYHEGGIVGLRPGEVPIIAQQGEEMLTRDDPRHMLNGGGAAGKGGESKRPFNIINAFDSPTFLESALNSSAGGEVLLNFMRANKDSVQQALE